MSIEKNLRQQYLKLDRILSSGKDFKITPENVTDFYPGMQGAIERKSCRVCGLDNRETIDLVGGDGKSTKREVIIGGKKCSATERETTTVTIFKYIGSGIEEEVTTREIDSPIWACSEFIKRVYPVIIKKP